MKFRLIPKLTAVILTLILCIGCAGSVGYAEGEDKGQSFESLDSPTDFISTDEKKEALEKSGDLPASFDLRSVDTDGDGIGDRCYVTPVRSQYPFVTCWGFSAIAAAETNILSTVLAYDPDAWKTLNLSEKQLAFFANVWLNDPDSSQYGEGIYSVNGEDYTQLAAEDIYAGGNAFLAAHTFAAGVGPVRESRDELYEYKGKNGKIQESYEAGGINFPTSYSKDDDWLLDESHRYQQDYVLSESYYLPSPALINKANQYSYNEAGTAVIKEHIKGLNAVAIGFHADESRPWQTSGEGTYMNAVTWAHYTWEPVAANHAVTIIGWDDNYSKENFASGHQPPADGAWLVKNSWGSGLNEFPDKGSGNWGIPVPKTDENGDAVLDENGNEVMVGSGYFWLSYYDQSITTPEVLLFDPWLKGAGTRYDPDTLHRDQYDLMPVGGVREIISQDPAKTANVFEPEKTEHVLNVAFEVATPGTVVNYEIYLLTPDSVSPEDGVLLASGNNSYPYGGYYQEYMDEPVIIQKGQRYSIVTTASLPDGSYGINTPQAYAKNAYIPYGKGIVNEGESLLYINGTWQDWSTDEARGAVYKDLWEIMRDSVELDNFPIKGIAYDAPLDIGVRVKNVADEKLEIKAGDSADLSLEVFGSEKDYWDAEYNSVEWKVEGEDGQFVSLTPSEDGLSARLSGLKPGTAYVYAYMHDVGTALVTVNVAEAENEPDGSNSMDNGDEVGPEPDPAQADDVKLSAPSVRTRAVSRKKQMKVTLGTVHGAAWYKVAYRKAGSKSWKTVKTTGNTAVIKKLKTGGLYQFRAAAVDSTKKTGKYSKIRYRFYRSMKGLRFKARKKAVRATWKKTKDASGYQVLISEKKDLKGAKVITVKGKNRKAYTVKDLRKGKRYYIAVRPYKTKGGKRYIGIRSKIKAVKVR